MPRIAIYVTPIVIVLGIGLFAMLNEPIPNTGAMRLYFVDRQPAFEQRNEELLQAHAAGRTYDTGPDRALGYRSVRRLTEPPGFAYITHVKGDGRDAFGTGVAYLEQPPEKLYPSLEAMADDASEVEGFVGYGAISGPWYFFMWEAE